MPYGTSKVKIPSHLYIKLQEAYFNVKRKAPPKLPYFEDVGMKHPEC